MTPIADRMEIKRIEFYADLVDVVDRELCAAGVPPDTARAMANCLADSLSDYWGGQNVNFPQDYRRKLSARDMAIYEEFNGWDYCSLARKYKMSERGMRKLIDRARAMVISRVQVGLFEPPDAD